MSIKNDFTMLFTNPKIFVYNRLLYIKQLRELEWANLYHDSIRGYHELEDLDLHIGRMAGNYSFFYVLNRLLKIYKPKNILELGLGESSKFIATFVEHYLPQTKHIIVEHDKDWCNMFSLSFNLSDRSVISYLPMKNIKIKGHDVRLYDNFTGLLNCKYDLVIVDGPLGSKRFSRSNILDYVENLDKQDNFIIILDDTDRLGEQDTMRLICKKLSQKKISFYKAHYSGNKRCSIISTYKHVKTL